MLYVDQSPKGDNTENYLRTLVMLATIVIMGSMGNMEATEGNIIVIASKNLTRSPRGWREQKQQ